MEFLVEKIGMSRTMGVPSIPVTLLKVLPAKVCEIGKSKKSVVAYSKGKQFNKAIEGKQKKYSLSKEYNKFASISTNSEEVGDLDTSILGEAKLLRTTFNTKGRGFTGVVKRWGFAGGPGGHGHRMGRKTGSIGNAEYPGRVMKGKKMPGQHGNTTNSLKNTIVSFDKASGILVLKGSVSGANGAFGKIKVVK
jgi:large subunit ribosomal protein L3